MNPLSRIHADQRDLCNKQGSYTCSCSSGWASDGSPDEIIGDKICSYCPPNTYKENVGAGECLPCPRRSTSDGGASTCTCIAGFTRVNTSDGGWRCQACPYGTYKPSGGNQPCSLCPPNTTSRIGSISRSYCICDYGFTGDRENCQACQPGTYKPIPGAYPCMCSI